MKISRKYKNSAFDLISTTIEKRLKHKNNFFVVLKIFLNFLKDFFVGRGENTSFFVNIFFTMRSRFLSRGGRKSEKRSRVEAGKLNFHEILLILY